MKPETPTPAAKTGVLTAAVDLTGMASSGAGLVATLAHSTMLQLLRAVSTDDRKTGLSRQQLTLLWLIATDGPIVASRLAVIEDLSAATVQRSLAAMKRRELVSSTRPGGRGESRWSATTKGRDVLEQARRRRLSKLMSHFAGLDASELATVEAALHLLRRGLF